MGRVAPKRILVTGGTGLVGSHLIEALLARGAHIVVPVRSVDPGSYFATEQLDRQVIQAIGDIRDQDRMYDIITRYNIDTIVHLAAQAIVTTAYANPLEAITTNVLGTANILEAARRSALVRGVIVASSDKAYGKRNEPYVESDALRGDHPYEASKAAADLIAQAYAKTYKLPVIVTRFGNIYGPGDLEFSRIIPGIMKSAVTGETLEVRSDGTFKRDYVYVKDVVSGYLFLLDRLDSLAGGVFNLSSDDNISVLSLIKKARTILKKKIPFTIANTQRNEIPCQHVDYSKITKLGWKPKHSLSRGLKETYTWYYQNRKALL